MNSASRRHKRCRCSWAAAKSRAYHAPGPKRVRRSAATASDEVEPPTPWVARGAKAAWVCAKNRAVARWRRVPTATVARNSTPSPFSEKEL